MTAWLVRNRWFLIGLVVLIPVAVVVSMLPRFIPHLERSPHPVYISRGEVVTYSGSDIELRALAVLDGTTWNAPAGADVVVATLAIEVNDPSQTYCVVTVVSTEHGVEREWDSELFSDSDYQISDNYSQNCDLTAAGSYELQMTFLVPHGEVAEPFVQLSSSSALPLVLRLN